MAPVDPYEAEFNGYLALANTMMAKFKRPEDVAACNKWISKMRSMTSPDVFVKKNRNAFFEHLLDMMKDCLKEDMKPTSANGQDLLRKHRDSTKLKRSQLSIGSNIISRWSPDKRTYVAVKPLQGRGALIYMAVTKSPAQGWNIPSK